MNTTPFSTSTSTAPTQFGYVAHAFERAAFYGREAWVAMKMGCVDSAAYNATMSAMWAYRTGRILRDK